MALELFSVFLGNKQPVSYTQMDSLTCGIYPLIPLSDTGFPSHTSADSNFLLQMLPITSMFFSSTHKAFRCGHFSANQGSQGNQDRGHWWLGSEQGTCPVAWDNAHGAVEPSPQGSTLWCSLLPQHRPK